MGKEVHNINLYATNRISYYKDLLAQQTGADRSHTERIIESLETEAAQLKEIIQGMVDSREQSIELGMINLANQTDDQIERLYERLALIEGQEHNWDDTIK